MENETQPVETAAAVSEPAAYEAFTMPEGVTMNEEALGRAAPVFRELGLPQEGAQKLIDLYLAEAKTGADAHGKAWAGTVNGWQGELKTWLSSGDNKEFSGADYGGDRIKELQSLAAKAIDTYGGADAPALREHLKRYALGDYGPMARFIARVGRTVREDRPPRPKQGGSSSRSAQQMYSNSNMNE